MTEGLKYRTGSCGKDKDYITREGIFRYMWMNTELTEEHKCYVLNQYPHIYELHNCIKEFRRIFEERKVPLLYLFVEKYSKSEIKALRSFANGLSRDIDAVENAGVCIVKLNYPKLQNKNGHCCKSKLDKVAKVVYRLSGTV